MPVCVFYLGNQCKYGNECKYSHDVEPVVNTSKVVCLYFRLGNCRYGTRCKDLHPSSNNIGGDASAPANATQYVSGQPKGGLPCRYFASGRCKNGSACPFIHENAAVDPSAISSSLSDQLSDSVAGGSSSGTDPTEVQDPDPSSEDQTVLPYDPELTASDETSTQQHQIELCRYFGQGQCLRGSDCKFRHISGPTDIVDSSLSPLDVLRGDFDHDRYLNGDVDIINGDQPPPSQTTEEQDATVMKPKVTPDIVTTLCKYFASGACNKGNECRFRHGGAQIFTMSSSSSPFTTSKNAYPAKPWVGNPIKPCKYYAIGACNRGDSCTFLHESAQSGSNADISRHWSETADPEYAEGGDNDVGGGVNHWAEVADTSSAESVEQSTEVVANGGDSNWGNWGGDDTADPSSAEGVNQSTEEAANGWSDSNANETWGIGGDSVDQNNTVWQTTTEWGSSTWADDDSGKGKARSNDEWFSTNAGTQGHEVEAADSKGWASSDNGGWGKIDETPWGKVTDSNESHSASKWTTTLASGLDKKQISSTSSVKVCFGFLKGTCTGGSKCRFSHDRSQPCPYFHKDGCRRGGRCPLMHDLAEKSASSKPNNSTGAKYQKRGKDGFEKQPENMKGRDAAPHLKSQPSWTHILRSEDPNAAKFDPTDSVTNNNSAAASEPPANQVAVPVAKGGLPSFPPGLSVVPSPRLSTLPLSPRLITLPPSPPSPHLIALPPSPPSPHLIALPPSPPSPHLIALPSTPISPCLAALPSAPSQDAQSDSLGGHVTPHESYNELSEAPDGSSLSEGMRVRVTDSRPFQMRPSTSQAEGADVSTPKDEQLSCSDFTDEAIESSPASEAPSHHTGRESVFLEMDSEPTSTMRSFSGASIRFGHRGLPTEIITAYESPRIVLSNLPFHVSPNDIQLLVAQFGRVTGLMILPPTPDSVSALVEFSQSSEAEVAAIQLDSTWYQRTILSVRQDRRGYVQPVGDDVGSHYVRLSWNAPSRIAWAFYNTISIAKAEAAKLGTICFEGRQITAAFERPRKSQTSAFAIKIMGLPLDTDRRRLQEFCVGSTSVTIGEPTYVNDPLDAFREQLGQYGRLVSIKKVPLDRKHTKDVAIAQFATAAAAEAAQTLNNVPQAAIGHNPLSVQYVHFAKYSLVRREYVAIKGEIDQLVEQAGKSCKIQCYDHTDPLCLHVYGQDTQIFTSTKLQIEKLLLGDLVKHDNKKVWDAYLDTPRGAKYLDGLNADATFFIRMDTFNKTLRVLGGPSDRERAKKLVRSLATTLKKSCHRLPLRRQVIGPLLSGELVALSDRYSSSKFILDVANMVLLVWGKSEVVQSIRNTLSKLELSAPPINFHPRNDFICPTCWRPPVDAITISCGHTYCKICLRHLILTSAESSNGVRCIGQVSQDDDGDRAMFCHRDIPFCAFPSVLSPDEESALLKAIFTAFVRDPSNGLHFCPSPGCDVVYRERTPGIVLECPSCFARICPSCKVYYHEGLTCGQYIAFRPYM